MRLARRFTADSGSKTTLNSTFLIMLINELISVPKIGFLPAISDWLLLRLKILQA
jgi:hypothetical protein